jgi:hypothetical protein
MNKKPKIVLAAEAAKAAGYEYIASVVKSVYRTVYWRVIPVDEVIKAGKWEYRPPQWWNRGVTTKNLPDRTISRQKALRLVDSD